MSHKFQTSAPQRIVINSKTTGVFHIENIDGRRIMVTKIKPIRGDSVMKRILYPQDEVATAVPQFENMLAPLGHPHLKGEPVSASHPMAINIFNVGGWVSGGILDGKDVLANFMLDLQVAEKSDDGKDLINRIENGNRVGVSTGLFASLENRSGTGEDEQEFDAVAHNLEFDHTAILLHETAAGAHVGTALQNKDDAVIVCNKLTDNDKRSALETVISEKYKSDNSRMLWVQDVVGNSAIFEIDDVLYSIDFIEKEDSVELVGERIEVVKITTYKPNQQEDTPMENKEAIEHLENAGYVVAKADENKLITNEAFAAYEARDAADNAALEQKRKKLVENSDLLDEDVATMNESALDKLIALNQKPEGEPETHLDNSLRNGGGTDGADDKELSDEYLDNALNGTPKKGDD